MRTVRDFVDEFNLPDGRKLYLLGEGRLINLAAAEGHPASVMDMSFATQALAAEYLVQHEGKLENKVYIIPAELDQEIALPEAARDGHRDRRPDRRSRRSTWPPGNRGPRVASRIASDDLCQSSRRSGAGRVPAMWPARSARFACTSRDGQIFCAADDAGAAESGRPC